MINSPVKQHIFKRQPSPNIHGDNHMRRMMLQVMTASIPGMLALFYYFGWGVFIHLLIACATAKRTLPTSTESNSQRRHRQR